MKKRKKRRGLKFIIFLMIALLLWNFFDYRKLEEIETTRYQMYGLERTHSIDKDHFSPSALGEGNTKKREDLSELVFLLAGVDSDAEAGYARTDTLMLCKVSWKEQTITMLSIPRDTYAMLDEGADKINHAHAFGGIEETLRAVRLLLGVDVDYYLKVDMNAVMDIIDLSGGLEVDVEELQAQEFGLETGMQHLDGVQSLRYLQYRKGFADGDLGRVHSQQSVLTTALPQLANPSLLLHTPGVLMTMNRHMDTNIGPLEIATMLPTLFTIGSSDFQTDTLVGEAGLLDEISYYFLYEQATQELVDTYFSDYKTDTVYIP